jgi:D-amino-acid dehydrogenase
MDKVVIIGGGISGLSSARYLAKAGWQVTVLDKGDFTDNCSYGNAGFVCPSHYIQLATPGIARQGLKWMMDSKSPFYIQPRLNKDLINWGLSFLKSATARNVVKHGIPLRDIGLLSQHEYETNWRDEIDMAYQQNGMLEIFKTKKGKEECAGVVAFGQKLGLDVALIDKEELQSLEPHTAVDALGSIYYKCDGHLDPGKLMRGLIKELKELGVTLIANTEVTQVQVKNHKIKCVGSSEAFYEADAFVLAAGSWSGAIAHQLNLKMPLVAGRGYSVTVPVLDEKYKLIHPGLLVEGRCAFTPMGDKVRFGGTMEITSPNTPPKFNRVIGILEAIHDFFPDISVAHDAIKDQIWSGFRPVSGDGMPYLGRTKKWENLVVATGHSHLGLSLGAATGLIVSELLENQKTSVDISAFAVERFA